jgi:hypothetical protein
MKSTLLLLAGALSLGACQKSTVDPGITASDYRVDFDKDFALHYQQQATLPATGAAELAVRLDELAYSFCPEGLTCIAGPSAWPTLAITDAQGQTQSLKLPYDRPRPNHVAWLDTSSIRANGRRYLLTYTVWEVDRTLAKGEMPAKQDFALWFHVTKATR